MLGRLIKRFGEPRTALLGLTVAALGLLTMAAIPLMPSGALVVASVIAFAGGEGIFTACLGSTISKVAEPGKQGTVQGGSQGLQSLMQMAGPLLGSVLYARIHPTVPFIVGAGFVLCAMRIFATQTRSAGR